ncbi:MAG: pilus assembly protein [Anaerolineae bacterium]|nr:pilus assembly protein [Anaerolineae bacterium]
MKQFIISWRQKLNGSKRGQSLVEMAIITPLLLFLFLGVFEVGWALRGYLVLANVNRETVRYGVKNGILDYSIKDPATVGYDVVLSHTLNSLSDQLPLKFDAGDSNATIIMSHFYVDTGYPCIIYQGVNPKVPYEFDPTCDCNEDNPADPQWFTRDDLILHPDTPGYAYYAQIYGINKTTRLGGGSYQAMADQLALENNQLNCNVLKTGTTGELSSNNVFIAETFYDQPQLLGVPFLANRLTNPIPFYTHTAMRIVVSRDANTTNSVGPTCTVYPITFPQLVNPITGTTVIDAYEGAPPGGFGWLNWDPGDNSNTYVAEELHNPVLTMHDFMGLKPSPDLSPDPTNTGFNVGDWVSGKTGVSNSDAVMDELEKLVNKTILVPVYDTHGGSGSNKGYHVAHIARITINKICLPRSSASCYTPGSKSIHATFEGYADESCQ